MGSFRGWQSGMPVPLLTSASYSPHDQGSFSGRGGGVAASPPPPPPPPGGAEFLEAHKLTGSKGTRENF